MSDNFDLTRTDSESAGTKGASQQYLTFTVGQEEYGVDIMTVREIKGWTETTRLPNSPEFMRGVMNLRGLIIPIFDLRARFALGLTDATAKHVIVILAVGARNIGILVDTVSDILDVGTEQIKPSPASENKLSIEEDFINGLISLDNRMVVILNVEHLFEEQHLAKTA
jgi:purine-binding chemotaxis protein CheW